jgi:hypothetical protein
MRRRFEKPAVCRNGHPKIRLFAETRSLEFTGRDFDLPLFWRHTPGARSSNRAMKFPYKRINASTMDRRTHNSLRILGIIVTSILVVAACLFLGYIAFFIILIGGLSSSPRILHPRTANSFFAIILAVIALVTGGVVIIGRLYIGIVGDPRSMRPQPPEPTLSEAEGAVQRSEARQPTVEPVRVPATAAPLRNASPARNVIDRLVLAVIAQIAVRGITLLQVATRPFVPRNWTLMLLGPFILLQLPDVLLIYLLLKRPDRRAFTFLIAILAIPILNALFNPLILVSYRQIYLNGSTGLLWLALSGLIYAALLILSYLAIRRTGLRPKLSSVILTTVAAFLYFFFFLIREITPYLYRLWG